MALIDMPRRSGGWLALLTATALGGCAPAYSSAYYPPPGSAPAPGYAQPYPYTPEGYATDGYAPDGAYYVEGAPVAVIYDPGFGWGYYDHYHRFHGAPPPHNFRGGPPRGNFGGGGPPRGNFGGGGPPQGNFGGGGPQQGGFRGNPMANVGRGGPPGGQPHGFQGPQGGHGNAAPGPMPQGRAGQAAAVEHALGNVGRPHP